MTVAAEHALRTLGENLCVKAQAVNSKVAVEVLSALGVVHIETANQLQAEREGREAKLQENPGGFRYDKQGGKHGTR